ncbi:hypothetical protein [Streptomyces qinzhouensis]|uniref:Uncharacterized protein n=1 Tax=Streptomyces qinzhouensis TaxID=2599401 RepID=A0A5B8J3Y8_9ACTN|nr:hypothetical protein [Streptomyces qinzhouensis]QDY76475.1 hypothetical protein FQU76_07910 [Streptomyces qinzhouensis]
MGGHRLGRLARTTRPVALLSAAATLLGALFLCLNAAADDHAPGAAARDSVPAFSCPYDNGPCGLRPIVGAAVLTAPPPAAPPLSAESPRSPAGPPDLGGPDRSGPLPRAPGLHVLQVLRI